jgi:hypothetical protein
VNGTQPVTTGPGQLSATPYRSSERMAGLFQMFDLERIVHNPSPWLMIFLLILIFWLVREITTQKAEIAQVREQSSHCVTHSLMKQFDTHRSKRQLQRIRDSYRRAVAPGGSQRFDLELQKEIDVMHASCYGPKDEDLDSDADAEDDSDAENEAESESAGVFAEDEHDFSDVAAKPPARRPAKIQAQKTTETYTYET